MPEAVAAGGGDGGRGGAAAGVIAGEEGFGASGGAAGLLSGPSALELRMAVEKWCRRRCSAGILILMDGNVQAVDILLGQLRERRRNHGDYAPLQRERERIRERRTKSTICGQDPAMSRPSLFLPRGRSSPQ